MTQKNNVSISNNFTDVAKNKNILQALQAKYDKPLDAQMDIYHEPSNPALKLVNDTLKAINNEDAKIRRVLLSIKAVVKKQDGFLHKRDYGCVNSMCKYTSNIY